MKFKKLIQRLHNLSFSKDRPDHHKEANVLEHSLQAFNIAKRESNDKELWVASCFHDVGKSIETLGHDKLGVDILKSFGYYNPKVFWLIENHIRVISFLSGEMHKQGKVQELLEHKYFKELLHLRRIDNKARNPNKTSWFMPDEINQILEKTNEQIY